jgi:hypothetical protein
MFMFQISRLKVETPHYRKQYAKFSLKLFMAWVGPLVMEHIFGFRKITSLKDLGH